MRVIFCYKNVHLVAVPHHGEHFLIEPQILRCPATGHDQGVVIGRVDAGEICI